MLEEIADFLASGPTAEDLLQFHPSAQAEARAQELIEKLKDGELSAEERRELDQFEHAERLVRLIKARIHARKPTGRTTLSLLNMNEEVRVALRAELQARGDM